jgi:methyl-accepting chemotaxis protein
MAKPNSKEQQEELEFLKKQRESYESAIKTIREFNKASQQRRGEMQKDLVEARKMRESFEEQFKSLKNINTLIEKTAKGFSNMTDELSDQQKRVQDLGKDWDEIDDLQNSISSHYGKQYGDIGQIQKKIDGTKALITSISALLDKNSDAYGDQLDKILDAAETYKSFPATFATLNKQVKQRKITESQMVQMLKENLDDFDEMVSKIKIINSQTGEVVDLFKTLNNEQDTFNKAQAQKSQFKPAASALITESPLGSAPVVGGAISKGTQSLFSEESITGAGTIGLFFILGKALGSLAEIEKAFSATDQEIANNFKGRERYFDAILKQTDMFIEAQEKITERVGGFTEKFAQFDFDTEMGNLVIDFNKVSKTAFFGSALGSPKYAKDQLALAGISASEIASTMSEMSTGANSAMQGLGEDVAVFSKKTDIASSQVAGLTGLFRMLDKTGGADAFKNLEKSLSGVGLKGFNVADIANELANSSELALHYNIKSGAELVKQVKNVRDMGASFAKIAEAGKSMVLNYKDSISKEMELSAMLGENVDLSEARALFAAGRSDEAFGVLKSSGILEKAQSQGLFAMQSLQSAIGGMDLTQLAAGKYETGPKQGLISNTGFLSATKEADRIAKIEAANFQIDRAIIRLTDTDLDQALAFALGTNQEITRLELAKMGTEIQKFIDVEGQTVIDAFSPSTFIAASRLLSGQTDYGMMGTNLFPGGYGTGAQRTFTIPDEIKKNAQTPVEYIPGKSGVSSTQAGISNLTPGGQKYSFETSNKLAAATAKMQEKATTSLDSQGKLLQSSDASLKMINAQSTLQTQLLQNIQALTAATSRLGNIGLGDMKLLLDGKEVKSRIEKIKIQEKGKTK